MTTLELTLDLPDSLARDAEAEGLLTSPALAKLLKEGIARRAAERLLASAARASAAGSKPMSMRAIQAEVNAVRASRPARKSSTAA